MPAAHHPLDPARVMTLDIKTTGLDRRQHDITEMAVVSFKGDVIWSRAVEPGSPETKAALSELSDVLADADAVAGHSLQRDQREALARLRREFLRCATQRAQRPHKAKRQCAAAGDIHADAAAQCLASMYLNRPGRLDA